MENKLKKISNNVRLKVLEIVAEKKVGHIGGTFSCVDLLVTLYYGGILNYQDKNFPDRFILSKGHACLALYVILEDLGFISKIVSPLRTRNFLFSLQKHIHKHKLFTTQRTIKLSQRQSQHLLS